MKTILIKQVFSTNLSIDDITMDISKYLFRLSEVLERAGRIHPGLMLQELEVVRHKHRERKYCDRLTQHLQHLL